MDTIIFLLILGAFLTLGSRRRWLPLTLFFAALIATALLFVYHVTDPLGLSF